MSRFPKRQSSASKRPPSRAKAVVRDTLFHAAFTNSPAMHSIVRFADAILLEVNETFTRTLGYTREEVIGRTPLELNFWVAPELLQLYRQLLEAQGFVRDFEVELRTKDGRIRTVLLSSEVVRIRGVQYSLSAGVDITARKQAEAELRITNERLRQSEERFSKIFRTSPAPVVLTRLRDGLFVAVNEAFLRITGFSEAEVVGRTSAELNLHIAPEQREEFLQIIREGGAARDREFIVRAKNGQLRTLLVSAERVDIDGEPHAQTVGLDITDRKRTEAELQNALEKERELSQLKSDFVALVSHEFRTPLEIIMSSADNLDRYHERLPSEKREHLLRTINKSVRRMSGMMEEVLVLGRLETDRLTFKPSGFDLQAFCERLRDEIVSATARRCPIHLTVDPRAKEAFGDESLLRHILTNLLSNAVKYSPPLLPVDLLVDRRDQRAVCTVADRGCGIPEPDQRRLFQAFHRGSNVRQIPGTGLGLLIVHRCVQLHGGTVQFASREGEGTTFVVELPLFAPPPHESNAGRSFRADI